MIEAPPEGLARTYYGGTNHVRGYRLALRQKPYGGVMGWTPTPEQREALIRARQLVGELREGSVTWKAIADKLTADGYPTMHGAPWSYKIVQRLLINPPPAEPSANYATRHWRVADRRGSAKLLKCAHCAERGTDKQAYDWARLHDRDGMDPRDYIPLCRKCHIAFDGSGHHQSHTEEARAKMSAAGRRRYGTDEKEALARANPDAELPRVGANPHNANKKNCPQDHEYNEENTYIASDGSRHCKKCARERTREWQAKEREKKINDPPKVDTHGKGTKRTGQALENIRLGSQRRREREQAAKAAAAEAAESGGS